MIFFWGLELTENRQKAARGKQKASARSIAKEIWRGLDRSVFRHFPHDFVLAKTPTTAHQLPEGAVQIGRELFTGAGALGRGYIMVGEDLRYVGNMTKAEFVQARQKADNTGTIQLPDTDEVCEAALRDYKVYRKEIEQVLLSCARRKTADERLQDKWMELLWGYIQEYSLSISSVAGF